MKKILIVSQDMHIGGAQKSLLSFLHGLADSELSRDYEVHLLLFSPHGPFFQRIPDYVKLLPVPETLYWMGARFQPRLILEHFSVSGILGETKWLLEKNLHSGKLNRAQRLWSSWKKRIPAIAETYDVAISYIDGPPNYYVMDKVSAKKKVLWVHSTYQKQGYDPSFDWPYFHTADAIVTISEQCRLCLQEAFPQIASKFYILENITFSKDVLQKSQDGTCHEYSGIEELKLLTVGRLHFQKGIDLAVDAAAKLKEAGCSFLWLVVGDGAERSALQEKIDSLGLSECFQMVGARENPYIYMKNCDILVQPSRVEGKSIVLDEVKVLCKPIVATDYLTVNDSITHGETGYITEMTGEGIARGILRLARDTELMERLTENLRRQSAGNEQELLRYVHIMF